MVLAEMVSMGVWGEGCGLHKVLHVAALVALLERGTAVFLLIPKRGSELLNMLWGTVVMSGVGSGQHAAPSWHVCWSRRACPVLRGTHLLLSDQLQ